VSHIGVTDRNMIERKGFTVHCVHLNSQSQKGPMHVVERWVTVLVCVNRGLSLRPPPFFYYEKHKSSQL
jgi:hypothetical protein